MLTQAISLYNGVITDTKKCNQVAIGGYYVNPGTRAAFAVQNTAEYGTATDLGTLTGAVQFSATTVDSDFVTAASFTATADSDTSAFEQKEVPIPANAVNMRYVATASAATIKHVTSATIFMVKRSS